jgi:general nucleoside transport system permease protein
MRPRWSRRDRDDAEPAAMTASRPARWWKRLAHGPLPSILVAAVVMVLLLGVIAPNPGAAFSTLLTAPVTGRGLAETIARTVPIVALALAVAYTLRAGILNLGGEGQMVLGSLAAGAVALYVPGPPILLIPLAYVAAALTGGLWAILSGFMFTRLGLPIFITSLLLNYPARSFVSYLVRFPLKDPGASMIATPIFPGAFDIPSLAPAGSFLDGLLAPVFGTDSAIVLATRTANVSIIFVVALVAAIAFVNARTSAGYETGMLGRNGRFAAYGGVDTKRAVLRTMFISGAICGVVGAIIVFGTHHRLIDGAIVLTNYAWTALLVALLAGSGSIALLVTGIAFAAIVVAGGALQRTTGVSAQIANVTQAVIIIFVSLKVAFPTDARGWWRSGRTDLEDRL